MIPGEAQNITTLIGLVRLPYYIFGPKEFKQLNCRVFFPVADTGGMRLGVKRRQVTQSNLWVKRPIVYTRNFIFRYPYLDAPT